MPYKRPGSPYWQVRRKNLPGLGDTGVLTTRVKDKRTAERMERCLEDLATRALVEPSYRDVLDAVIDKRLDLPTLLSHHTRGDVDALRVALNDPPLKETVEAFLAIQKKGGQGYRQKEYASKVLLDLAPPRARFSWIRSPKVIVEVCVAAERGEDSLARTDKDGKALGRKRNSVRRHLLRFISLLLRHELGRAERDRLMADVRFPGEDDTREVLLSPDDLGRLLQACDEMHRRVPSSGYDQLRTIIRLAVQTSADRGVLLAGDTSDGSRPGLEVRQVRIHAEEEKDAEIFSGEVYLRDWKADSRPRTVPITDSLCRELLALCAGKGPDEQVFDLSYAQLDVRWKKVRKRANLEGLRFKDLRAQTAIYAERAGVSLTVAAQVLGHGGKSTTRRYQRHQAAMTRAEAAAIEREMGVAVYPSGSGR